jgi:importin-7
VWLKNRVHTCYDMDISEIRSDRTPIPQSDCDALKSSLLSLLASSTTRSISIQLASALKDVISRDFPDKWPTLLPKINTLLASSEIREVVAGCLAALELIKAFE